MSGSTRILLLLTCLVISDSAMSYGLATHARVTQAAAGASIMHDVEFFRGLGIDPKALNPFGTVYYDVSEGIVRERSVNLFEVGFMPVKIEDTLTLSSWLLRGAIREDDAYGEDNPQDDPYNRNLRRPLHHFFDPIRNLPLSRPGLFIYDPDVHAAPNWGIGAKDAFADSRTPEAGRRNHFTAFDAGEAMYRALTGHSTDGSAAIGPGGSVPATAAELGEVRKAYWATTFRALGDLVHLVQDMAQPQHTRNDPHAGKGGVLGSLFAGDKSMFEAYVDARATMSTFDLGPGGSVRVPGLTYAGYAVPRFDDYVSYFSTRHRDADPLSRKGMADYSNRGFFSAGRNLRRFLARYDLPTNDPAAYGRQELTTDWRGLPLNGKITLLTGTVPDSVTGRDAVDVPLTSYGLWDQFLQQRGFLPRYTLNRYNYAAMADLLIPRAVAYSAGLLDFFFRGRMEFLGLAQDTDPKTGVPVYRIRIRNISAAGNDFRNGRFSAYYDAADGMRKPLRILNGGGIGAGGLASGGDAEIIVAVPSDRPMDGRLVVVFDGLIGSETGVAGLEFYGGPFLYVLDIVSNQTYKFARDGRYIGWEPGPGRFGLSVYNGVQYAVNLNTVASSVGIVDRLDTPSDTSVNDSRLLVSEVYGADGGSVRVQVYDHSGRWIRSMNTNPGYWSRGGMVGIASGNGRFATTNNEQLMIYTGDGVQVATINGIDIGSQEVAMTRDRIYVMDGGLVKIYDLNGGYRGTVGGDTFWWFPSLAATEWNVYVVETAWNGVGARRTNLLHVYDRVVTRDANGSIVSDTYSFHGTIDFSSVSYQPRSASMDGAHIPLH